MPFATSIDDPQFLLVPKAWRPSLASQHGPCGMRRLVSPCYKVLTLPKATNKFRHPTVTCCILLSAFRTTSLEQDNQRLNMHIYTSAATMRKCQVRPWHQWFLYTERPDVRPTRARLGHELQPTLGMPALARMQTAERKAVLHTKTQVKKTGSLSPTRSW